MGLTFRLKENGTARVIGEFATLREARRRANSDPAILATGYFIDSRTTEDDARYAISDAIRSIYTVRG